MRIAIVGAGGVGGYFGGRLAQAGADVRFLARGAHLEALRTNGLRIESQLGDAVVKVRAASDPADIGTVDLVMVAVKLWDTESVLAGLRPLMGPSTAILSLQNGVSKDDLLRDRFGADRTLGALCYIGAVIERPGVIKHNGALQRIVFGEFGGAQSERTLALERLCTQAKLDVAVSPHIERATWEKFVFLVGFSGATSVVRQPIGPIRADPEARKLLAALFEETVAVGRAHGVDLAEDFAADRLAFVDKADPSFSSSMSGDLARGNRLELPWLQGAVAAFGREHGVPTPANDFVVQALSVYANGTPALVTT